MGNPDTIKSPDPNDRDAKTSKDRSSEATSDQTVSDLEESEKSSDSRSSAQSDVPSPDGSLSLEIDDGPDKVSDPGGPM